jgi:hypothetical protein
MTAIEVRPVTAADREALARFSCRSLAHPWTDEVETTIHHLADELEMTDSLVARGIWDGADLLGVVVWRMVPTASLCQSLVLAVQTGHRRRGYARTLKRIELEEARQASCRAVISKVHWDNTPMMKLNKSLGANVERITGDRDYAYCIIGL